MSQSNQKYFCFCSEEDGEFFWSVKETSTNQVIESFHFEEDAMEYANFLIKGGAFDGFTPSFVLREVVFEEDINDKFISSFW